MNVMMDWFLDLTLKRLFLSLGTYSLGYLSDYKKSSYSESSMLGRLHGGAPENYLRRVPAMPNMS